MVHTAGGHHHAVLTTTLNDDHIHELFDHIDADGSGYISKSETDLVIDQLEPDDKPACIQEVVDNAFTDGKSLSDPESGANFDEFMGVLAAVNVYCHPEHP
jgi:hypothetical protein